MIVLIVCVLFLSFAMISGSEESLIRYTLLHAEKNTALLETYINQVAGQIDTAYLSLLHTPSFCEIMEATDYSEISIESIDSFRSSKDYLPENVQISLHTPLINTSNIYLKDELEELTEQTAMSHRPLRMGFHVPKSSFNHYPFLTFGYNYISHGEKTGAVFFSLNATTLLSKLPITLQNGQYYMLVDRQQNEVFLGNRALSQTALTDIQHAIENYDLSAANSKEVFSYGKYFLTASTLNSIDCTLYSLADKTIITSPLRSMYLFSFLILVVLISVILLISINFRHAVISPLSNFGNYIAEFRKNPNKMFQPAPSLVTSGCSEIQAIEQEFSALIDSVGQLSLEIQKKNEDLYKTELLYKNTQIEQLRSQINPHFLYNTLELIRADAIAGKIDQVSAVTSAMGKLYRYSIKGAPIVALEQELELIRAYLTIQQNRFDGKITVFYNISPEAKKVPMPKMILQPLIENSIVHGIEPTGNPGTIFIGATVQNDMLLLSIRDDGVGIPPDRLEAIQTQLRTNGCSSDSMGIANVNARLKLQYGACCSFELSSEPSDGTCISIRIPTTAI